MRKNSLHERYNHPVVITFLLIMVIVFGTALFSALRIVDIHAEETSKSTQETATSSTAETASGTEGESKETVAKTGTVKPGTTKVRIRTSPDTSTLDNVITMVDGGFKLEILDTVKVSDSYIWYKVAFYLNGVSTEGYISGEYVVVDESPVYDEDMDFEKYLDEQNFPESYRADLRALHAKYPKWVFVADHVSNDWNDVVKNENVVGRSLISKNSISSWKSTETKINSDGSYSNSYYNWETSEWYRWDGGNWVQASVELLEYTLDPRNFLNETNIFMFEKLSFDSVLHNRNGVINVIGDTFMKNSTHDLSYDGKTYDYAGAIMYAAQVSGVSPYHLTSRIIQEQGTGGTGRSISGTVPGYEGYYNYFNMWASAGSTGDPVVNGLIEVSKSGTYMRPWNSRMKSIIGGSLRLGENYINKGQDTIYYEKFDLKNYWHQYMTHVLAPRSESVKSAKAYSDEIKANTSLVFHIPVYKNMPAEVCKEPTKDGSPNNTLNSLSVEGYDITPSFERFATTFDLIVEGNVTGINVNAAKADSKATVTGDGNVALKVGSNEIKVVVTAQNGDVRTYTINVVRKEPATPEPPTEPPTESPTEPPTESPTEPVYEYSVSNYVTDASKGTIAGFTVGDTIAEVLKNVTMSSGVTAKLLNSDGTVNNGIVATGNRLVFYKPDGSELGSYTVVIYGDANGDGSIDIFDVVRIKRIRLGFVDAPEINRIAADCDGKEGLDIFDIVAIKRHMMGTKYITQK